MNKYELSIIADTLEEDALYPDEIEEILGEEKPHNFKEDYLDFYDDIKTTPDDDW